MNKGRLLIVMGLIFAPGRFVVADKLPPYDEAAIKRAKEADDKLKAQIVERKLPEINFNGNALGDVIDFLRDVSGESFFVNWRALEAAKITKDAPITVRVKDVKLSKALDLVPEDAAGGKGKLGWEVGDGVITISTAEDLRRNTQTKAYDIRKIIGEKTAAAAREKRIATLLKLVTGSVDPSSWRDNGGKIGAIKELSGQLVITQTGENHKAIANLIEQSQSLLKDEK